MTDYKAKREATPAKIIRKLDEAFEILKSEFKPGEQFTRAALLRLLDPWVSNIGRIVPELERLGYIARVDDRPLWELGIVEETKRPEQAAGPSCVYFIQNEKGEIKIGTTTNLQVRLASLITAASLKLTLLATIPGDEVLERWLHTHFKDDRLQGEWFTPSVRLLNLVMALRA
jgi:hypothetical protein